MHLFLTGPVGCGKSTVLDRVLALTGQRAGGFRTGYGPDRACPRRFLYLWDAGGPPRYEADRAVAQVADGRPRPLPGRFDALGAPLLTKPSGTILVMDECGRLEQEEENFQRAVLAALDGARPVLGVLREGFPGWTRAIALHPGVEVVTVTAENRDALPELLAERFRD